MSKLNLTDVASGYELTTTVNANNEATEVAVEKQLSRDGTSPNQMEWELDMNSFHINNVPDAVSNSQPVTLGQANILASVTNPLTRDSIGSYLYPQTTSELSAGVTPTNYYFPEGAIERYGTIGAADDSAILQIAFTFSGASGVPIDLNGKTFTVLSNVTIPYNAKIISNGATIDGSGITLTADLGDNYEVLSIGESSTTDIGDTDAAAVRGDYSIDMSGTVSGLASGDIGIIYDTTDYSWSGFRDYYRKGEMFRVESLDDDEIILYSPLYDDYDSGVDVVKLNGGSINLTGTLTVIGCVASDGNVTRAVWADGLIDTDLSGIIAYHGEHSACVLRRCFNVKAPLTCINNKDSTQTTKYGLQVAISQHVYGYGCYYASVRHGLTFGGAGGEEISIVCRDLHFHGSFISLGSNLTNDVPAFYSHGNAEHYFLSGMALGGVDFGGDHGSWDGDVFAVSAGTGDFQGRALQFEEMLGWNFKFRGRVFAKDNPVAQSRGVFDLGGNDNDATANTTRGGVLDLSGLEFHAPAATELVRIRNRGSAPTDPIIIKGRNITSVDNAVTGVWFRYETVSGNDAALVDITGSYIDGVDGNVSGTSIVSEATLTLGASMSWTATTTGMASEDSGSADYIVNDDIVQLTFDNFLSGTSDATTFTITGLPVTIAPRVEVIYAALRIRDNGAWAFGIATIGTDGVITLAPDADPSTGWTASGVKTFGRQTISYPRF